jgi:CRP-like cAMP-binding protein
MAMTAELLKNAFDLFYPFPLSFWKGIDELGETITVGREQTIKEHDKTEQYLYYIIEGSGGIFLWNNNNFVCSDMCLNGEFFCDYYSFVTQMPTPYQVITFEKSLLFRISHSRLSTFLNESGYADQFWRYALQALFTDKHNQYIQSFLLNAESFYRLILEYRPEVIQRIPQKYIASYLGITPQSLSRIRRSI